MAWLCFAVPAVVCVAFVFVADRRATRQESARRLAKLAVREVETWR